MKHISSIKFDATTFLCLAALLLSSKFMLYSALGIGSILSITAVAFYFAVVLIEFKKFGGLEFEQRLAIVLLSVSLLSFNLSKLVNYNSLGSIKAVWLTDLPMLLSACALYLLGHERCERIGLWYSNIISAIIAAGIVVYVLFVIGVVDANGIVVAPDHAHDSGYLSIYHLAYTPSWWTVEVSGLLLGRFSSVFWEPGTLGLYLIFLIGIELFVIKGKSKYSRVRFLVYLTAGAMSLSLLFYVVAPMVFFSYLISNRKANSIGIILGVMIAVAIGIFSAAYWWDALYDLILYRLEFDSSRGFVGNTRSGSFSAYLSYVNSLGDFGGYLSFLMGNGPFVEFSGDSTGIFIKLFQRGIFGFSILALAILVITKAIFLKNVFLSMALLLSLSVLTQIEGAIFALMVLIFSCINHKEIYNG